MTQIVGSTLAVTNGSQIVTDTNATFITDGVSTGYGFTVVGSGDTYEVGSVDSETQITLTANYTGVSATNVSYAIFTAFTIDGIPELARGDIETSTIWTRAVRKIQDLITQIKNGVITFTSLSISGDVNVTGDVFLSVVNEVLTSSPVIDAVFIDTTKDSNPGWIKNTKNLSYGLEAVPSGSFLGRYADETAARTAGGVANDWYARTNTTEFFRLDSTSGETQIYRAGQAGFPKFAIAVIESNKVVIYDMTTSVPSMWMVATTGGFALGASAALSSIAYKEGVFVIGNSVNGLRLFDFTRDKIHAYTASAHYTGGSLGTRLTFSSWDNSDTTKPIVNSTVNDVAITVMPSAPSNSFGLKEVTIAVATAGGVSVIKDDSNVWDSSSTISHDTCSIDGSILTVGVTLYDNVRFVDLGTIAADGWVFGADHYLGSADTSPLATSHASGAGQQLTAAAGLTVGNSLGVSIFDNERTSYGSQVVYITKDYNTGWMPGDIRTALLADSVVGSLVGGTITDRSVKAHNATVTGTLTRSLVHADSDIVGYSGFTTTDYISQPYTSDLDFGTSDFYFSWWFKQNANTASEAHFERGFTSGSSIMVRTFATGEIQFYITDDAYVTSDSISTTSTFDDNQWHKAEALRSGSTLYLYVDNILVGSTSIVNAAGSLSNASAGLRIGERLTVSSPATNLSLSIFRVSATVPTADQRKVAYETERRIFDGNKCLLDGSSNSITALDYNQVSDVLNVGTSWGRSTFKNLVRVSSEATTVGSLTTITSAGDILYTGGSTGSVVKTPELNSRESLIAEHLNDDVNVYGENGVFENDVVSERVLVGIDEPKTIDSAWNAIQIGYSGLFIGHKSSNYFHNLNNAYPNSSGVWTYNNNGFATLNASDTSGNFTWYTAPSGTAGNPITWTEQLRVKDNAVSIRNASPKTFDPNRPNLQIGAAMALMANVSTATCDWINNAYYDGANWRYIISATASLIEQQNTGDIGFFGAVSGTAGGIVSWVQGLKNWNNGGVTIGNPSGGNKGLGTLNAVAVYDDNVLLTCYIPELMSKGSIDLEQWDSYVPDKTIEEVDPETKEVNIKKEARQHEGARRFDSYKDIALDVDKYSEFWKTNGHLISFPSREDWLNEGPRSTGDLIQRLWETVEIQAALLDGVNTRLKELEKKK